MIGPVHNSLSQKIVEKKVLSESKEKGSTKEADMVKQKQVMDPVHRIANM